MVPRSVNSLEHTVFNEKNTRLQFIQHIVMMDSDFKRMSGITWKKNLRWNLNIALNMNLIHCFMKVIIKYSKLNAFSPWIIELWTCCRDLKVIILGDYAVGKTSLICRYIEGKFKEHETVSLIVQ